MKKLKLGDGGIKALALRHVEKVIFGVCVLLVLLFVYSGFRLEGYDAVPNDIRQRAQSARQHIDRDTWEAVANEPERITETNYATAVDLGNAPTRGALYPYEMPLKRPLVRPLVKRSDPEIYAPVQLIVRSMNAPIAVQNKSGAADRFADLENAKPPEPPKKKEKKEETRPRRGAAGAGPGMMPQLGAGPAAMPQMQMPGTGGEATTGDATTEAVQQVRLLQNPEGWRPGGGSSMGMGMMMPAMPTGAGADGLTGAATSPPISQPAHIMALLFLVPYEKQTDEYQNKLENAVGYNPQRDRPNYLAFQVERAEVPEDPNAELEWRVIGGTGDGLNRAQREWAGVGNEVAHPAYLHPFTSMPIPPILLRDFEELALHPEIPKKNAKLPTATPLMPTDSVEPEPSDGQPSILPRAGAGAAGPGGMLGAMPSMNMPSMPATGSGAPGMMPGVGGMMGGPPAAGMPGVGGPGMMAGMGSYGANVTEWKLGRYFDMTAEPGKTYRYRVQLLVEDPNHPRDPQLDVSPRMLDDTAAARVTAVIEKEPKEGARQHFYVTSEWSEPSEPISLPPYERFFAGGPKGKLSTQSHKNGAELLSRSPEAKMVAVVWDDNWGLDVTFDKEIEPGSVLDHEGDIEAVHPLSLEFKIFEDYDLRGGACVVDMRGGIAVGGEGTEPLLSPSEFAVVDAQGNLVVRTEVEDLNPYRRYAFVDETATSGGGMAMPGAGMAPGMAAPGGGMQMPMLQGPGAPGAAGAPGAGGPRGGRGGNRRGGRQ